MFKFSKAVLPLVLFFTAACGTDLQRASAQDLAAAFHAPAPAVEEGTGVTDTTAKARTRIVRAGGSPRTTCSRAPAASSACC